MTNLKTISKPVTELDFPSVTICKDGLNFQTVREVLEMANGMGSGSVSDSGTGLESEFGSGSGSGSRRKRTPTQSGSDHDYCQLKFNRTCDQVSLLLQIYQIVLYPIANLLASTKKLEI